MNFCIFVLFLVDFDVRLYISGIANFWKYRKKKKLGSSQITIGLMKRFLESYLNWWVQFSFQLIWESIRVSNKRYSKVLFTIDVLDIESNDICSSSLKLSIRNDEMTGDWTFIVPMWDHLKTTWLFSKKKIGSSKIILINFSCFLLFTH